MKNNYHKIYIVKFEQVNTSLNIAFFDSNFTFTKNIVTF